MRMRKKLLHLLSFLFILFNQAALSLHDNPINKTTKLQENSKKIVCVDVADFFYEIILSVTSFPEQGDCSDKEDAEIAALLQRSINNELRSIPGTIKTQNKVCDNPINDRRLSTLSADGSFSLHDDHPPSVEMKFNTTVFTTQTSNQYATDHNERNLLRKGRRSFIYIGGGRCRLCLYDNEDHRLLLSPPVTDGELLSTTQETNKNNELLLERRSDIQRRNLLFVAALKPFPPYPTVADILLCKKFATKSFSFGGNSKDDKYRHFIQWINLKNTRLPVLNNKRSKIDHWDIIGPYVPGESFGLQVDMAKVVRRDVNGYKEYLRYHYEKKIEVVQLPVKEGTIHFQMYAFDMPTGTLLTDDPLIIFINGIKLDFNVLKSQPNVKRSNSKTSETIGGSSFAGIEWKIVIPNHRKNLAYGSQLDARYIFYITAPLVVLSHKNQFDIDFLIQPHAKGKQYAIRNVGVTFSGARCKVTDLENSSFEDFKSVVESRLFHKLGMDLAHEFQGKKGHCLYDKIPVVNVHLVEKNDWTDSKPQCS